MFYIYFTDFIILFYYSTQEKYLKKYLKKNFLQAFCEVHLHFLLVLSVMRTQTSEH